MKPLLEVTDLKKSYGGLCALGGVSLEVHTAEILGIVGRSGCGKSTLLRIISGLEKADGGSITLDGVPLGIHRGIESLRRMQMVFQDASGSLHPRKTVRSSINDAARSLMGRAFDPKLDELCGSVGLDSELLDRYPRTLSGGQCQRFAIARAIVSSPEILLCDEATSALDVTSQAQVLRLLASLRDDRGTAIVFVSHDLAVVSCLCDRIIVMDNGGIVEHGSTREVLENPREDYTKELILSIMRL